MKKLYVILLFAVFVSCKETNERLNFALEAAANNRSELEKVLEHYSTDSLKYQAAVFLIENMPGHYSYAGDDVLDYYELGKKLFASDLSPVQQRDSLLKLSEQQFANMGSNTVKDINIIKGDYLIKNIDDAFNLWQTKPWAQHLNFEQFCECLLPYKFVELQELDNWRDTLAYQFGGDLDSIFYDDERYDSPYYASKVVRKTIIKKIKPVGLHLKSGYPFLSASTMYRITYGRCSDYVNVGVAALRSLGIPVFIESTPQWGRYRSGHSWFTLFNDKGDLLPSAWDITTEPSGTLFPDKRIPKIYRSTYAINWKTVEYLNTAKYKRSFNIFQKDVTDKYYATSDLSIPVLKGDINDKYVYIAVFNGHNMDWNIIDYGELNHGKAKFNKMGRNVLYIALGYNDNKGIVPITYPFILHKNGNIESIIADSTNFQKVTLRRKYYSNYNVAEMQQRILKGMIQASNYSDFSGCDTIYTINNLEFPDQIELVTNKSYRYWRYMSPNGSYGSIAELRFFKNDQNEKNASGQLNGQMISSIGSNNDIVKKAFDDDWLSNFETENANGSWVGMDCGEPIIVDKVRCVPRNDDNYIHVGDEYELNYWDNTKWISAGKKVAEDNYLVYDSIPGGALLWLKNNTRGWDERVFIYRDGKQEWW